MNSHFLTYRRLIAVFIRLRPHHSDRDNTRSYFGGILADTAAKDHRFYSTQGAI
jgi:hypothetical protein